MTQSERLTSRDRARLAFALALSITSHTPLLFLTFGGLEPGLRGFGTAWEDRRGDERELRVVVDPSSAEGGGPAGKTVADPVPPVPTKRRRVAEPVDAPSAPGDAQPPRAEPSPEQPVAVDRVDAKAPAEATAEASPTPPPTLSVIAVEKSVEPALVVPPPAPHEPPPVTVASLTPSGPAQPEVDEAAWLEADRQEAAQQAARAEAARQEAARLAVEQEEAERQATVRREAARVEAARVEAGRVEAGRQVAVQQAEAQREEEAKRMEAIRSETERQEAAKEAIARRDAAVTEEAGRREAARVEAARQEATRQEAEREEAARVEATRLEAERQEAARQEAARSQATDADDERREAARRAMGRQLDAEAAQRATAATAARNRGSLPYSLDSPRRGRLYARTHPNAELALYGEAWARKIQFNTPPDVVRELAKNPHTDPLVTVAVRSDGSVQSVTIVVSSGSKDIDAAIARIVESHVHYQAFPPAVAREFDVIEIRRYWAFDSAVWLY